MARHLRRLTKEDAVEVFSSKEGSITPLKDQAECRSMDRVVMGVRVTRAPQSLVHTFFVQKQLLPNLKSFPVLTTGCMQAASTRSFVRVHDHLDRHVVANRRGNADVDVLHEEERVSLRHHVGATQDLRVAQVRLV